MRKYTIHDFEKDFPDDDACLERLFKGRWPEGVTCKVCSKVTPHARVKGRTCYYCTVCGTQVYPMAGTIFADSRTPLRFWFKAISIMAVTRCGVSSRQLSRDLGVTVKTGYRMWFQIRQILTENNGLFTGTVEIDETYVGGRAKNMHASKRTQKRGHPGLDSNKTTVFGMVERDGDVVAQVVPDVARDTLLPKIQGKVAPLSVIYTDELSTYEPLTILGYEHKTVNHKAGVYVDGSVFTNTIEGFWSQLKRSIDGTYHHVTRQHLQDYVNEYSFRYNHRNDERPMFETMLEQVVKHAS